MLWRHKQSRVSIADNYLFLLNAKERLLRKGKLTSWSPSWKISVGEFSSTRTLCEHFNVAMSGEFGRDIGFLVHDVRLCLLVY